MVCNPHCLCTPLETDRVGWYTLQNGTTLRFRVHIHRSVDGHVHQTTSPSTAALPPTDALRIADPTGLFEQESGASPPPDALGIADFIRDTTAHPRTDTLRIADPTGLYEQGTVAPLPLDAPGITEVNARCLSRSGCTPLAAPPTPAARPSSPFAAAFSHPDDIPIPAGCHLPGTVCPPTSSQEAWDRFDISFPAGHGCALDASLTDPLLPRILCVAYMTDHIAQCFQVEQIYADSLGGHNIGILTQILAPAAWEGTLTVTRRVRTGHGLLGVVILEGRLRNGATVYLKVDRGCVKIDRFWIEEAFRVGRGLWFRAFDFLQDIARRSSKKRRLRAACAALVESVEEV
ncbi:hypothetical protein B0H14DRAFT_2743032 [Mycena olivaceomarginata]|nr:hypothetical protein B0H14DRAFT_2743032 [Mycena olivaceomarginata]